jgi:transglutaminase/protease-like cytokinesis protein 3
MQKYLLLLVFVLCFSKPLKSQDFAKLDSIVNKYNHYLRTPKRLANQINKDFTTDIEKARAIYSWIAQFIEYDTEAYFKGTHRFSYSYSTKEEKEEKEKIHNKKVANYTFKKKMGVCAGYATLFQNLCELSSLECTLITGYSKTKITDIGNNSIKANHAWNAVKIDDDWRLIDATWGAGYLSGKQFVPSFTSAYFDTPAKKFDLNHHASDSIWNFTKNSITEFIDLPLYYCTFLDLDFEIDSPKNGSINVKSEEEITLIFRSDSMPKGISYSFSHEKYSTYLKFEKNNENYEAKIPVPKSKSSSLTLYYSDEGLVKYVLKY